VGALLLRSLKDDLAPVRDLVVRFEPAAANLFERIRCPLCAWQPESSSRWCCDHRHSPEPPFACCGTVWNTFETEGKCPGCAHQWIWTSCHRCSEFSRHEEWYDAADVAER
jgi:hypothetical protein